MKTKHLGKNNSKVPTGFKILDPIERNKASNSYGVDFWNAYEFSFLDSARHPVLKVLEIIIPASSLYMVESKSLKLYLNFFYKKKFLSDAEVKNRIARDLNKLTQSIVKVKFISKFYEEPKSLNLNKTSLKFTSHCASFTIRTLATEVATIPLKPEFLALAFGDADL